MVIIKHAAECNIIVVFVIINVFTTNLNISASRRFDASIQYVALFAKKLFFKDSKKNMKVDSS